MSTGTIAGLVREHIMSTRPPEKRSLDLTDSTLLVSTGVLDSVGVFDLVAFLEARFGIQVADEELEWKTFESVDSISQFVESKLARVADLG